MNFYKHHLGDYDGATMHLSWDEDQAYTRLLRVYYRLEKPIPLDPGATFRLVRATTKVQKEAVTRVLHEFFSERDDGWHNVRADEEIGDYQAKASLSRAVGKKGGNPYWEQQYEHPGFLYAARIDAGRVKVGITKDWNQRRYGLAKTYKTTLTLLKLASVKCMGVAEEAVLDRFREIATGEVLSLPAEREAELLAVMAEFDQPDGLVVDSPNHKPRTRSQNQKPAAKAATANNLSAGDPAGRTVPVWKAYAEAYQHRYGVEPVRNKQVNGMLARYLDKLPAEEAPLVAAFYVGHSKGLYVSARHCVDLLLRDAEGLRTEWATGRKVTDTHARQADQTETRGSQAERLLADQQRDGRKAA